MYLVLVCLKTTIECFKIFSSIKRNKPITIFKNGKQTRTFCYVTDAITAMLLVIIKGNNFVYNIGTINLK